jgi:upstream activation factor subunit UAF30
MAPKTTTPASSASSASATPVLPYPPAAPNDPLPSGVQEYVVTFVGRVEQRTYAASRAEAVTNALLFLDRQSVEFAAERALTLTEANLQASNLQAAVKQAVPVAPAAPVPASSTPRKPRAKATANHAFLKPMQPDAVLAVIVGSEPQARTVITQKLWQYIKQHGLQDPQQRRMINADAKLTALCGKAQVSMFEMTKLVNQHLTAAS